jgi:flavin-dependent dehydrogenase
MPALEHPSQLSYIDLPTRKGIRGPKADVLVVGGGPAGLGAALGAANAGAKVILAERYGFLGGNATVALVNMLTTFHTRSRRKPRVGYRMLFPTDHGPGEPVIRGVLELLVERLVKAGVALPPSLEIGHTVPFDPEIFKLVAMDLLDEAGVKFLFHAFASGVTGNKKVGSVIFETKSGPVTISADVIVDCTGDGDIAACAGAPFLLFAFRNAELFGGFADGFLKRSQFAEACPFNQIAI